MTKKDLVGVDVDVETSLAEYGIAWEVKDDEVRFYYGIEIDEDEDTRCPYYSGFDWASFPIDTDVFSYFDWADFDEMLDCCGLSMGEYKSLELASKICELSRYYGHEEIFGTSYYGALFTLDELLEDNE